MSIKFTILLSIMTIILKRKIFHPYRDDSYSVKMSGFPLLFPRLVDLMLRCFASNFRFDKVFSVVDISTLKILNAVVLP